MTLCFQFEKTVNERYTSNANDSRSMTVFFWLGKARAAYDGGGVRQGKGGAGNGVEGAHQQTTLYQWLLHSEILKKMLKIQVCLQNHRNAELELSL